jgi:hypothetical protein
MGLVTGRIRLKGWQGEPGPATVYVCLLDTSRADVPALTVSTLTFKEVALDAMEQDGTDFVMDIAEVNPHAYYTISVLVDLNGDGQSSRGDYQSMQAYPVLTHGHGNQVEVYAKRIP